MVKFTSFRTKDPVIAALLSFGLFFGSPAMTMAQTASNANRAGWEEVGPAAASEHARRQLMGAPPRVVAAPLNNSSYRPPVTAPATPVVNSQRNAHSSVVASNYYTVQAGDTLPKIAMKVYGDPNKWQNLMVLNNIDNGNRIFVGQKLVIASPNSNSSEVAMKLTQPSSQANTAVPDNEISEEPAPSVSADAAEADSSYYNQTGGSYTVQRGDTLGKIAKRILGSSRRWRELARANQNINPNRLKVGDRLIIPGARPTNQATVAPVVAKPISAAPAYQPAIQPPAVQQPQVQMTQPTQVAQVPYSAGRAKAVSAPSFDPPPLLPPPAPTAGQGFAPPPAPPVYSGGTMTPPPPPVSSTAQQEENAGFMPPPPPPALGTPGVIPVPQVAHLSSPKHSPSVPVAIGNKELYRETKYTIPGELKPTDFTPYFANDNGYTGLFRIETAFLPYIPTWNIGFTYRYRKYQYLDGKDNVIDGNQSYMPLVFTYAGKKMFAGLVIPFQSWEVSTTGNSNTVSMSSIHDPSINAGYQIWKNLEGTDAVTLHISGRFSSDNYSQPYKDMSGKGKTGGGLRTDHGITVQGIGPAGATRGSWVEIGGAYSGKVNEKWTSHLNLALADDSEDSIVKYILRGGMNYRINHNFSLVGEVNSTSYDMEKGPEGTNMDLILGAAFYNDSWQGRIGFPISVQHDWGYGSDFGMELSVTHRWD